MEPLNYMLFKTHHAIRHKNRKQMEVFHLSPGQPKVLSYLNNHPNCKLKDIALNCDIENATASKMVNALEEKKLLKRSVDPSNKRAYQLNITELGLQSLEKWNKHCLEIEEIALEGFSDEEKDRLGNYLSRIYTNLTGKEID